MDNKAGEIIVMLNNIKIEIEKLSQNDKSKSFVLDYGGKVKFYTSKI